MSAANTATVRRASLSLKNRIKSATLLSSESSAVAPILSRRPRSSCMYMMHGHPLVALFSPRRRPCPTGKAAGRSRSIEALLSPYHRTQNVRDLWIVATKSSAEGLDPSFIFPPFSFSLSIICSRRSLSRSSSHHSFPASSSSSSSFIFSALGRSRSGGLRVLHHRQYKQHYNTTQTASIKATQRKKERAQDTNSGRSIVASLYSFITCSITFGIHHDRLYRKI